MSDTPALLGNTPMFENKVPMVRPWLPKLADMHEDLQNILESGMVTKGQYQRQFEAAVAEHLGVRHAVAVSSCTTGLMLTYQALGLTGDVVLPSFTFMATASSLVWAGLKLVFADVDAATTNIDPEAAEAAITPHTSAIVAVHNFGNPAAIDQLQRIADRHGLKLIYDAAHGFGAQYQGIPVGRQGDAHVYSLSPTKLLVAGEGGIVATNNDELAHKIRLGREYGNDGNYDSVFAGINARLPEFNHVLALHGLPMLEQAATRRNEVVALYRRELGKIPGISFQAVRPGDRNSYREFGFLVDEAALGLSRNELSAALQAEHIDTRHYYDPPVHRQSAYRHFAANGAFPHTDWLARQIICLPLWSHMSDEIAMGICQAAQRCAAHAPAVRNRLASA
ncbi:MAG: DegT/DnrJ/EryC1/StrS family aminotransferase [Blastochloris sp.]|nr:DegT/DnrJ/EryC1/StrS family aminotransferase [Blastochloris sp.]